MKVTGFVFRHKFRYPHPQTDGEEKVLPFGREANHLYCVPHNTFFIEEFNTVHFLYFSAFFQQILTEEIQSYILAEFLGLGYSSINSLQFSI